MKLPELTQKDRIFSQQTGTELQRHNRSDSELKQQHEILLSTLLLEQQLHSTSTDEHKRRVNEETLLKLCDEIRPNLILATGGTTISLYDITPEVCVLVLLLFNRLISALGGELSYYKENFGSSTDNDWDVISNYLHGYAFE
ncbi:unnamed protein product, partial [Rotaria magnacalcarata]